MKDRLSGLSEAHAIVAAYQAEIIDEHERLPRWFFGLFPRRRHYEIMAVNLACKEIATRIFIASRQPKATGETK